MNNRTSLVACAVAGILLLAAAAHGDEAAVLTKEELAARYPVLSVSDIHDGPVAGLYEISAGTSVQYVTTDGRFLIRGEIVEINTERNITERSRAEKRATLLAAIDPKTEIIFSPADQEPKYHVTVFTDMDCGYCRQFHHEIAAVNALGIEVRYVSYPRTGPNTESWAKAEAVWCAGDRNDALTKAKLGAEIAKPAACEAPSVAEQYDLGGRLGLTGTPGIYSDGGVELGGYLPPVELLARLQKLATDQH